MLNFIRLFIVLLLCAAPVLAAGADNEPSRLRDVPAGHYAYDAVYELIDLGVTKGFPDGTFRGDQPLSRYETAGFLSKFNLAEDKKLAEQEKLLAELRAEVNLLNQPKKETVFSWRGLLDGGYKSGQAGGASAGHFSYRLKIDLNQRFDENSGLRFGFDTMDSGFDNASRDLAREMLEAEGWVRFGNSVLTVTSGPGDVIHFSDPLFPSENGAVYRRLKRGAKFQTGYRNTAFGVEYLARSSDPTGLIADEELSFPLLQNFRGFKVGLNPRLFSNSGEKAVHFDLTVRSAPTDNFRYDLLLGAGRLDDFEHGLYAKGEITLWKRLTLFAQKIGDRHRESGYYPIFDAFDRPLSDGAYDLGFHFKETLNDYYLILLGDYIGPGTNNVLELTLGDKISPAAALELKLRLADEAVVSNIVWLGLKSSF